MASITGCHMVDMVERTGLCFVFTGRMLSLRWRKRSENGTWISLKERWSLTCLQNNGSVVGATAVNTRTGEFMVIKAKATIVATGLFARLYNPETPLFWKYKFRYHWCPATVSGDGWGMAYRAGAELACMGHNRLAFQGAG